MNPDAVEKALREALAAHDAAIVMDPAKGYHFGTDPEIPEIAKSIAARLSTLPASPLRESLLMGEVESLRATLRKERAAGNERLQMAAAAIGEIADELDGNDPMKGPGYGEFADMLRAECRRWNQ